MSAPRTLGFLVDGVAEAGSAGVLPISGLSLDSREITPGDAFIALRGAQGHGIEHAAGAVARGAAAVLFEAPARAPDLPVPVIAVAGLRGKLGRLAAHWFDAPSQSLRVVGVTGTNGKTSTVQLVAQALTLLGARAATIGTLGAGIYGEASSGERTTPDVITVQRHLAAFRAAGAGHVAMEVSSHALDQGRVDGVRFELAVFTNLTRDHLDYHGTMEDYFAAKAKLFAARRPRRRGGQHRRHMGPPAARRGHQRRTHAVVQRGGRCGRRPARARLRGQRGRDRLRPRHAMGQRADRIPAARPLQRRQPGRGGRRLGALGHGIADIARVLGALTPVAGRMNRIGGDAGAPLVVVDYAHTPDALSRPCAACARTPAAAWCACSVAAASATAASVRRWPRSPNGWPMPCS